MKTRKNEICEEYFLLTETLDEVNWALDGDCDDIDCDKYMYKNMLKKKYKPVLEHNFSCMKSLRNKKITVMRLLSEKKYRKYRYAICKVCKQTVDKLNEKNIIVSYTRPSLTHKGFYEWEGDWTHNKCRSKVKIPKSWKKF